MAQLNFGGVIENVMTREEFPLEKAREILKDETIAVIGYGVQGPGQACNLRDNGFNVIVGQRQVRLTRRQWQTDGFRVKLCSALRMLAKRVLSSCACCPMRPLCLYGPR